MERTLLDEEAAELDRLAEEVRGAEPDRLDFPDAIDVEAEEVRAGLPMPRRELAEGTE
jgi:hypothetical protein